MTSDLRKYIESKHPCKTYNYYVEDTSITNESTLYSILTSEYISTWDKDWLVSEIFEDLGSNRFYGLCVTWVEEFFIIFNKDNDEVRFKLKDVIPFLEEVLYYIMYEKEEED